MSGWDKTSSYHIKVGTGVTMTIDEGSYGEAESFTVNDGHRLHVSGGVDLIDAFGKSTYDEDRPLQDFRIGLRAERIESGLWSYGAEINPMLGKGAAAVGFGFRWDMAKGDEWSDSPAFGAFVRFEFFNNLLGLEGGGVTPEKPIPDHAYFLVDLDLLKLVRE